MLSLNPKFFHERGALSAARLGDQQNPKKASNGSQFYIVQGIKMSEAELRIDQNKMNQALQQFFQDPANKATYDSIMSFIQSGDRKAYQDIVIRFKASR
jgi:peptidyl-prolyl cis-trans isomerase B (cyclophilin B)